MINKKKQSGFSLLEIMIAAAVIGIFFAGIVAVYFTVSKGIMVTRWQTVATNLAQEKIEYLKNISYSRLSPTSSSDLATYGYDNTYYPPEQGILVGDLPYERRILIQRLGEDLSGKFVETPPASGDTGIKKITVTVLWTEGGKTNQYSLSNVIDDPNRRPLEGNISGTIREEGTYAPVESDRVAVQDNFNWNTVTDANGNYTIKVATGNYQIRTTKKGYWQYISPVLSASDAGCSHSFNIKKMASGSAVGYIYINEHMLVSKVAASSITATSEDIEWVELYNPTTNYLSINSSNLSLKYVDEFNSVSSPVTLDIHTSAVGPHSYYLIANSTFINCGSYALDADASYSGDIIKKNKAGGIIIEYDGGVIDKIGWSSSIHSAPAGAVEGTGISGGNGISQGKTIVRLSAPPDIIDINAGNAYDSDNNQYNFAPELDIEAYKPLNSSFALPSIAGTPVELAIISCEDGLSSPATSYFIDTASQKKAYFELTPIATGSWTLWASYTLGGANAGAEISNIQIVNDGDIVGIPNNTTVPLWPYAGLNNLVLSSATTVGYVSGFVRSGYAGLDGIKVQSGTGITYSNPDGSYLLPLEEGSYGIIANPGNLDPAFVWQQIDDIPVYLGQTTSGIDFDITPGGGITGGIKTEAGDNLSGILGIAYDKNNLEQQSALSDLGGIWNLENLSVNGSPYTIKLLLDPNEASVPLSRTVYVTAGVVKSSDASNQYNLFSVSPAMGVISGSVRLQGKPIDTGVLVIASTSTIPAVPQDVDQAFRASSTVYYGTISSSNGIYEINVRGGQIYNVSAWYSTVSGTSAPQVFQKTAANKTVTAGQTINVDFDWP